MTFEEANDSIQGMIKRAWGFTGRDIFYVSIPKDRMKGREPFLRISIHHQGGGQRTLGGRGERRFERTGFVMAQIYTPAAKGLQESYQLAKVISDAIEGNDSPEGVWFRRLRINEVGVDGMFNILNVIFDFDYHEQK